MLPRADHHIISFLFSFSFFRGRKRNMVRVKRRLDLDDGGGGYSMVLMAAHRPVSGTCSRLFGTNETLEKGEMSRHRR